MSSKNELSEFDQLKLINQFILMQIDSDENSKKLLFSMVIKFFPNLNPNKNMKTNNISNINTFLEQVIEILLFNENNARKLLNILILIYVIKFSNQEKLIITQNIIKTENLAKLNNDIEIAKIILNSSSSNLFNKYWNNNSNKNFFKGFSEEGKKLIIKLNILKNKYNNHNEQ
jgi:hypothetical protein